MKQDGCTKRADWSTTRRCTGRAWRANIELSAPSAQGLEITSNEAIDKNAANYRSLAQQGRARGRADCMAFAGITANNAAQVFKDFAAALPTAKLYGA